MLQRAIAVGLNCHVADTGRGEQRSDDRQCPPGTAEHDEGRPASSQDLLGLGPVPDV